MQAVNDHVDEQCTFQPALNPVSLSLAQRVRKSGGGLLDAFDAEHIVKVCVCVLRVACCTTSLFVIAAILTTLLLEELVG